MLTEWSAYAIFKLFEKILNIEMIITELVGIFAVLMCQNYDIYMFISIIPSAIVTFYISVKCHIDAKAEDIGFDILYAKRIEELKRNP